MRRVTLRVILRTGLGLAPGLELDRFERKLERFLSHGRQRYALVLMTMIPIRLLSGSRWIPLLRQLSDLDDDLFAFIAARRRGDHTPAGQNVLDDLLAATHEDSTPLGDRRWVTAYHDPDRRPRHDRLGPLLGAERNRRPPGGSVARVGQIARGVSGRCARVLTTGDGPLRC